MSLRPHGRPFRLRSWPIPRPLGFRASVSTSMPGWGHHGRGLVLGAQSFARGGEASMSLVLLTQHSSPHCGAISWITGGGMPTEVDPSSEGGVGGRSFASVLSAKVWSRPRQRSAIATPRRACRFFGERRCAQYSAAPASGLQWRPRRPVFISSRRVQCFR